MYHPNPSRFHIKKENIGLIEVMGLAILPGRLLREIEQISLILKGEAKESDFKELSVHKDWIEELKKKADISNLEEFVKFDVGRIFEQVLEDCNVFKYGNKEDFISFVNKAIY
jgi:UDPglucose--hexose-1-phosphate uridylyltransferase